MDATLSNSWDTLGDWANVALGYGEAVGETLSGIFGTVYTDVIRDPLKQVESTLDDLGQGVSKGVSILPWALAIIGILFLLFYLKGGAR